MNSTQHSVLIGGGGTAGITVAARLRRADARLSIGLIEPSDKHYYQPLWTLVGGGVVKKEITERAESALIPRGVDWLRTAATEFLPEQKAVLTADGTRHTYEQLVVCPGIQINWQDVPGLREGISHDGVCSNYSYATVDSTWKTLRNFRGGTALFTMPNTAVKCGGAPQKIMYLAED
jgi:sulfide:quinone oxidoreductase